MKCNYYINKCTTIYTTELLTSDEALPYINNKIEALKCYYYINKCITIYTAELLAIFDALTYLNKLIIIIIKYHSLTDDTLIAFQFNLLKYF